MTATRCWIALGSNMCDPFAQISTAIKHIANLPQTELVKTSSCYKNPPMGPIQDQNEFVNAVIEISTKMEAQVLFSHLLNVESKMGRVREERWGPRIIDVDLILFGDQQINLPNLIVPHPEMKKRNFVMVPLMEIAPSLTLPDGETVSAVVQQLETDTMIKMVIEDVVA